MKKFQYEAVDDQQNTLRGTTEADSEEEAKIQLISQGYQILTIEEVSAESSEEDVQAFRVSNPFAEDTIPLQPVGTRIQEGAFSGDSGETKKWIFWGLFAVAVLGVLFFVLVPTAPSGGPDDVVVKYYQLEHEGDFVKQFPLFSVRRKGRLESAENYAAKKKDQLNKIAQLAREKKDSEEEAAKIQPRRFIPVLQRVEIFRERHPLADVAVLVTRAGVKEYYIFGLVIEKRNWKIDGIKRLRNDPFEQMEYIEEDDDTGSRRSRGRPMRLGGGGSRRQSSSGGGDSGSSGGGWEITDSGPEEEGGDYQNISLEDSELVIAPNSKSSKKPYERGIKKRSKRKKIDTSPPKDLSDEEFDKRANAAKGLIHGVLKDAKNVGVMSDEEYSIKDKSLSSLKRRS